jgi:signal transduction histidine kinase
MKLLSKTTLYYIGFSVVIFLVGGIIFYHLLNNIFYRQIDENLAEEKLLIEETINHSTSVPDFRSVFGHMIEITILNKAKYRFQTIHDTIRYDTTLEEYQKFRHMRVENTSMRGNGYIINIYKPLQETESLIDEIIGAVMLLFISLLVLLVIVNYVIARRVWVPFYRTLANLQHYDINRENPLKLSPSGTSEFRLLNDALKKMSEKIRQDFLNLREFNENASHELQTPLAVIKSKLDLLIQDENLSFDTLFLITSIYDSVTRMSKLNQGLLLISKIENNQFPEEGTISLMQVLEKQMKQYEEMTEHKQIRLAVRGTDPLNIRMNRILAEILISNLLSNAVKHNILGGTIEINNSPGFLAISNTGLPLHVDPDKLFERFRKSSRESDSIGLGLAIVKKICHLYGIRVEYRIQENIHTLELFF